MRAVHGRAVFGRARLSSLIAPWRPRPESQALLVLLLTALLVPSPAHAMHLGEGVLPLGWAAGWTATAVPFLVLATFELRRRSAESALYKPFVAMLAAAVFVISCMPVPVPIVGTCSHPCGTGLAAILIGPLMTVLVTFVALLLQALFLAHGGLTTLGADIWSMGIVGGFVGYGAFRGLRALGASLGASAFVGGVLADWATYATTSFELAAALHGPRPFSEAFGALLIAFVPTQLPLGLLEGALTAGAVTLVARRRPALLQLQTGGAP